MNKDDKQLGGLLGWLLDAARRMWFESVQPLIEKEPLLATILGAAAGIGLLLWIGTAVIVNGVLSGLLIAAAFGVLIWKAKRIKIPIIQRVYNLAVEHPLATDIVVSVAAFLMAPAGITGWIAAGVAALVASVWLVAAQPVEIEMVEESRIDSHISEATA